jgi:hypothetical protein
MTKRQKIKEIFDGLKADIRYCELVETKNLNGEVIGYHQGLSFSMDFFGRYIYFRNYGQWADKATLKELTRELEDCNLDMIVTEKEFEQKTGKSFFGWGI